MPHERFYQSRVFSIPESLCVQAEVNIESADMRHLLIVQKEPRHSPSDDCIFSLKAPENLTDFNECRPYGCSRAIVIVIRRLGVGWNYFCHVSLMRRRCSAASSPRSPPLERSRYVWIGLVQRMPGAGS